LVPASRAAADPPPPGANPRLLFSAADVAGYQARFAAGGVPAAAWTRIKEKAEHDLLRVQPLLVQNAVPVDALLSQGLDRPYNLQNEMPTYLIELGFAYQMSGDVRYGRRVIELISALGDVGFPFWSGQDLGIGDLMEGVGLGFDWTYQLMTPAERTKIIGDIVRNQDRVFRTPLLTPINAFADNLNISNWMGVTTGGVGLALLALRGLPGVPTEWYDVDPNTPVTYWEKTLERINDFFTHAVDPAGANLEGLTYAAYGMKNAIPFAKALQRNGYGDVLAGTGVSGLSRWMSMEQLPGEGENFVPLNDSQRTGFGVDLFAQLFAINPNDGVAQWLWQRAVGPKGPHNYYREPHLTFTVRDNKCPHLPELYSTAACDLTQLHGNVWAALWYRSPTETPEVDPATVGPLSVHHAVRGLVDARTGFAGGKKEAVSTFEARRDGWGHYHYDIGNFTLYGEGGRFAIDPGYSCVACHKPRQEMTAAEAAQDDDSGYATFHNVVVFDNDLFTQSHESRFNIINDRDNPADDLQTIDQFVNAPNFSLAHGDLRYAYDFVNPEAGRDHFFSRVPGRPVLLAVTDHIKTASAWHSYRWQMLTNNTNRLRLSGSGFTIKAPNGAQLVGRTAAGGSVYQDPVMKRDLKLLRNPTDDIGKLAPVVYDATPVQPTMDHVAFMALTPKGEKPATTEIIRVTGANAIGVTWKGVQDVFVRKLMGAATVTGLVETDAVIAKFTRGAGETVIRDGLRLVAFGRDYVLVTGAPSTVTVSGHRISATSSSATNTYKVFAPQTISGVTVNGASVSSCRTGDYVSFPCTP
jgi:hypothetical protein